MEIYKKLQKAREYVKNTEIKKAGYNDYSKYYYFTPEQIDKLVTEACKTTDLITLFNMQRNELGLFGTVDLICINNPQEKIVFIQETGIPEIKATNIAQQLGGAVTYTKRYMLMNIFDIVDNNLDFDTNKPAKSKKEGQSNPENWLNAYTNKDKTQFTDEFKKCYKAIHQGVDGETYDLKSIRKKYKVSKETAALLEKENVI